MQLTFNSLSLEHFIDPMPTAKLFQDECVMSGWCGVGHLSEDGGVPLLEHVLQLLVGGGAPGCRVTRYIRGLISGSQ